MKMFRKVLAIILVAMMIILVVGCNNTNTGSVENDKKGKFMFIRMKTNPTTGFDYKCEVKEDSKGEIFLEEAVVEANKNKGLVGAPSYRTYIFSAENGKAGDSTIDFHYLRDWEGGEDGYHVYFDVTVDKNGNIIYKGKRAENVSIDINIDEIEDPTFADEYDIKSETYEEEPEN